jgi:glycosyltransferase involved in cell wall biosynthesis
MRVLIVHDEPIDGGYGAEAYVRRLVNGLLSAGDDVEVVAGELKHVGAGRLHDIWDPAARRLVREHCQRFSPDVVHFHNVARELSASVLGAAVGVPSVMTAHDFRWLGGYEHGALTPRGAVERVTARLIRRTAMRRMTAMIGVSGRVSDALRAAGFAHVTTIPVPVFAPASPPLPVADCRDVAVIARLAPDKGVDVAIEAFKVADVPGSRLLIAGDGPMRRTLERAAAPLGDRVSFLGRLDEVGVSDLLGRVRAVVVASQPSVRPEGSSMALVEAANHGRPVIATDDPAVVEVAEAISGVVTVKAADAGSLGAELRTVLLYDDFATDLGKRGLSNAQRWHSLPVVVKATRAVYRQVAAR